MTARSGVTLALLLCGAGWQAARSDEVTVFAAASLTEAISEVSAAFERESGHTVTPVFAGSSTLARQIESGAPADIFVSANAEWMDYLMDRALIDPATRVDLLANSLVVIAPEDQADPLEDLTQLPDVLGTDERLVIGDPDHVPAGIYAAESLRTLGIWDDLDRRTARTADVRAALALVARGEAPFGVVYATDAMITDGVTVVATVPTDSHRPIVYPAAVVGTGDQTDRQATDDYMQYLVGQRAAEVFRDYGFIVPGDRL